MVESDPQDMRSLQEARLSPSAGPGPRVVGREAEPGFPRDTWAQALGRVGTVSQAEGARKNRGTGDTMVTHPGPCLCGAGAALSQGSQLAEDRVWAYFLGRSGPSPSPGLPLVREVGGQLGSGSPRDQGLGTLLPSARSLCGTRGLGGSWGWRYLCRRRSLGPGPQWWPWAWAGALGRGCILGSGPLPPALMQVHPGRAAAWGRGLGLPLPGTVGSGGLPADGQAGHTGGPRAPPPGRVLAPALALR